MKTQYIIGLFCIAILLFSCDPFEEDGIELGTAPDAPTFDLSVDPADPNKIVITNTTSDYLGFVWDVSGGIGTTGTPDESLLLHDTIFYPSMGTYDITLNISAIGGGTAATTQTVVIDEDAEIECEPRYALLTDECTSKCWRLVTAPGSIKFGPAPFSTEWFVNGTDLPPEQTNDIWCFDFENFSWTYDNSGETLSACQGFIFDSNYPIPSGVALNVQNSGSVNSTYKIVLPTGNWMGVEDSGPEYEITSISSQQMELVGQKAECDGSPGVGFFTLLFEAI